MINLKTWLKFKYLYIFFVIITIGYSYYIVSNQVYYSKYTGDEHEINGYITEIQIDGNKVTIILLAEEKIIVNYYFQLKKDKDNFIKKYQLGDYIKASGTLETPSVNRVFNLFNYKNYLLSQKVYWIYKADNIIKIKNNNKIRYKIKSLMIKRIGRLEKSGAYLKAFILGDTIDINNEILNSYQKNGINHLLAISGMHITLLSTMILGLLNRINKHTKTNYIITISFLLFYLFIINFQPSAVRATLLFIMLTINKIFNFKVKTINYLFSLLCILLVYNPYYIYHLGFLFSFIISIYLVVFQKIINNYKNYIIKVFVVSLIAFLASIPILINNFFQINLLSPFINVIFVPLVSLFIFPLSLLTFIFPFLDQILIILINILEYISILFSKIEVFTIVLRKCSTFVIIFYYFFVSLILVLLSYKKYWGFFLLILVLLIHNNWNILNKYPMITLIDVGQGDSILIELPHNKGNLLIDTGGLIKFKNEQWMERKNEYSLGKNLIIPYLKSIGIKKLDYLIITHGDVDHIGSASDIINNYFVRKVILNSGNNNYAEKDLINLLISNNIQYYNFHKNKLKINNYKFHFINDIDYENENEDSLIIYTKLNNKNILLMGDAGKVSEKTIIDKYKLPEMDILKIGHHGSKHSTGDELLRNIKPKIALISVGDNNRFGHPSKEVLNNLNKRNIKSFLTSINGSIRLILNNDITIYTCL